jgi:hypothetical protein
LAKRIIRARVTPNDPSQGSHKLVVTVKDTATQLESTETVWFDAGDNSVLDTQIKGELLATFPDLDIPA